MQRYVYPLVAPPTPERLAEDKKSIEDQFERTFGLVEQLAKDTEALKAAEAERNEKLDTALAELESVVQELKTANRRREDEGQRLRDDIKNLKSTVPQAMDNQKEVTDRRLREVNAELKSLKTLITQRMAPAATPTNVGNYLRPASGNSTPAPGSGPATVTMGSENSPEEVVASAPPAARGLFGSGMPGAKASIPAWQMAVASKNAAPGSTSSTADGADAGSSAQQAASGSS